MTAKEIKYVEKLKEINKLLRGPRYYEVWSKVLKLEIELADLGKQCQFEMLCDPDIFEASANEHFEQENLKKDELIGISARLIGEIIDNYEADAINLPAEMYNDLKFHWKQLNKNKGKTMDKLAEEIFDLKRKP